jgi:hypothetical protein
MPVIPSYGLDELEESMLNNAKRRVIGFQNASNELLTEKPAKDPTNGGAERALDAIIDDLFLLAKDMETLDTYIRLDQTLIELPSFNMTSLKPNIKRGTAILIDVNNKLRKLTASYKKISKNIIYVDLSTFYDFINAFSYLKNANLRMCELMLSFTNSLRQANGLPEAEIRDPVDEDPTAGDEVQDVLQEGEQFADNAPLPPPSDEGDPVDDDPTDAEEEEGQELEDVAVVPQGAPILQPSLSEGTSGTAVSEEMDTDEMNDDPFQVLLGALDELGTPDAKRLFQELVLIARDVSQPMPDAGMADKAYINSFNRTLAKIRKVLDEVGNFEEEIDEIRARFTKLMAQNTIPSGIQSLVDKTRETASPEEIRALDKILGAYMRKKTKAREQKLIQYMLDRQSAQDAQDRASEAFEAEQKRYKATFI